MQVIPLNNTNVNTQNQVQNFDKKTFNPNEKPKDVRKANILAAKGNLISKNNL